MLNVVTWKYPSPTGHRHYTAAHVNRFFRQFAGHYRRPYLAICITDDPAGLDPGIEALPNPVTLPNNYRKLWLFSAAAARAIPGRIFLSDIDVDIVGDLTGLLDRDEDFVGWYDPRYPKVRWSTGNYLLTAGTRAFVWEEFEELGADAAENLLAAWYPRHRGMRKVGSDMAWLSYRLPAAEARFGPGIYRRRFIDPSATPADAKIIHYSGKETMELKALCIGLPKTGTTTLYKALCSAGLHAVHRHQPGKPAAGYIMHRNLLHGRPLLHGMETVEAVTQPDTCLHGMNVWPQMDADFLCRVRAEFPRCTFILQARDTELTLASIRAHGDLRERIVYAPGLYGAATTDNDIRAWIGRHYDSALEVIATLGGVTFDIASPEAPAALMQAMDIDIGWWGRANARA